MNDITYRLYGQEMEDSMKYIVKNEVKCDHCKDIIESTDTHDFKTCSCGMVSVDGGYDYLKRAVKSNPSILNPLPFNISISELLHTGQLTRSP